MAVVLRPDADIDVGGWTNDLDGSELFSSINEVVADDNNFIKSSDLQPGESPSIDTAKVSLSNPSGAPGGPVVLSYRFAQTVEDALSLTVRLLQGASVIAEWVHSDFGTSFVTVEQTLSQAAVDSITDYDDLFLEFEASSISVAGDYFGPRFFGPNYFGERYFG